MQELLFLVKIVFLPTCPKEQDLGVIWSHFPLSPNQKVKPCHTGGISAVTNARLYDGQDSFLIQQSMTRSVMVSRIHAWNLIGGQQTKAVSRSWLALNRKNDDVCFCIIKVIRFNFIWMAIRQLSVDMIEDYWFWLRIRGMFRICKICLRRLS